MRSSLVLAAAAALAVGALARPHNNKSHLRKLHQAQKVNVVTEVAVEIVTVLVTVTGGQDLTTSTKSPYPITRTGTPTPKPNEVYAPPPAPPSSTSIPKPSPASALAPNPQPKPSAEALSHYTPKPQPEVKPSPAYTPPAQSSTPPVAQPATPACHQSGPDQADLSSGATYEAAVLYHHNAARANHNAAPLTWDSVCEDNARIAAQKCTFAHYIPDGAGQGQNIFTTSGDAFNVTAGITESWYKSELPTMMPYFGQANIPDEVFHSVGHLTQMVWKGTTKVGCVTIDCGDKMIVGNSASTMNKFTVCNYAPAGNMGGAYGKNVDSPVSQTNLGGWAD
jgi:uncharacterized protein YkwD